MVLRVLAVPDLEDVRSVFDARGEAAEDDDVKGTIAWSVTNLTLTVDLAAVGFGGKGSRGGSQWRHTAKGSIGFGCEKAWREHGEPTVKGGGAVVNARVT